MLIRLLKQCLAILEPMDKLIQVSQIDKMPLSNMFTSLALLGPKLAAAGGLSNGERTYVSTSAKHWFDSMCVDAHGIVCLLNVHYVSNGMPLHI